MKFSHFSDDFEPGRMQQIIELVYNAGSPSTIGTLKYTEYEKIGNGQLPELVVAKFRDVVEELDRKLHELLMNSKQFAVDTQFWVHSPKALLEQLHNDLANEAEKHEKAKKISTADGQTSDGKFIRFGPKHELVIACKYFMMNLFSEFGESSFNLDIIID